MEITPTNYEKFVKELHEKIIKNEGFKNIEVLHDVKLQGKSGASYQIDVYWKLNMAQTEQKFCVECKYWKSEVKKSDIASFVTVLKDLGNAKGIFVTTKGYQKGAKQLAEFEGITLISANCNVVKTPSLLKIGIPQYHNVIAYFENARTDQYKLLNDFINTVENDTNVYDSEGLQICNLNELVHNNNHHEDGHYIEHLMGKYVDAFGSLIEITSIEYDFEANYFDALDLHGYSEEATIVAKYIFQNKEIAVAIDSYNDTFK